MSTVRLLRDDSLISQAEHESERDSPGHRGSQATNTAAGLNVNGMGMSGMGMGTGMGREGRERRAQALAGGRAEGLSPGQAGHGRDKAWTSQV